MAEVQQIEAFDRDVALGDIDLLAVAHALMRATTTDMDRAHGAGALAQLRQLD